MIKHQAIKQRLALKWLTRIHAWKGSETSQ